MQFDQGGPLFGNFRSSFLEMLILVYIDPPVYIHIYRQIWVFPIQYGKTSATINRANVCKGLFHVFEALLVTEKKEMEYF